MNLIYPVSFFFICGFLVVLPVYVSPALVGVDMLILAVGVVFYFVFIYWKNKPAIVKKFLSKLTTSSLYLLICHYNLFLLDSWDIAIQKLFLAEPEKEE